MCAVHDAQLTLEADTELCGEPSRDAFTEGPGGLSLSVEDERKAQKASVEGHKPTMQL